jgi:hypothetical protein
MKQCTTCNRVFDDETLSVCPDDGSTLVSVRETPTTQGFDALGGKATWSPSQDQIAEIQQYVTTTKQPQRKIWPWVVVAIVVLFILIGCVGVIVFSRL